MQETGAASPDDGAPAYEYLAEWDREVQRGEAMRFLNGARQQLPWYPVRRRSTMGLTRRCR